MSYTTIHDELKAVFFQQFLHNRIRAGRDFVDHAPRKAYLIRIVDIFRKARINKAVFHPGGRI